MSSTILLSGSLAYDYIMDFPDSFKHHILPDRVHMLNVCFVVDNLKKNFGGTAGNIAHTMRLLGSRALILSPIGDDGGPYIDALKQKNISTNSIRQITDKLTASAYITTDKDDNQITAFYNGSLDAAKDQSVEDIEEEIAFAILSPTKKEATLRHAKECHNKKIPFCFDPGQNVTAFSPQELMQLIGMAGYLIGNDYEMKLIEQKTGWNGRELLDHAAVVITTLGAAGSVIETVNERFDIPACNPQSVEDPTGAGDAYRAGFFSAHINGLPYETCAEVGSVAASYAIEHYGTQNHTFTLKEFTQRYTTTYKKSLTLDRSNI